MYHDRKYCRNNITSRNIIRMNTHKLRPCLAILSISSVWLSCQSNSKINGNDSIAVKQHNITTKASNTWIGKWDRNEWQNEAGVDITKITGDSLIFSLQAVSGGHTGEIEGKAFIRADKAFFRSPDDPKCSLIFTLKGDSVIMVTATGCEEEGGMDVGFDGKFVNVKYAAKTKKKADKPTLVALGILNDQQDEVFRKLVGKSYDLFLNSIQLTDDDVKDLDNMHAKVMASGVRGLYTFQENIIMIDSAKNICAAVLDDEKVYYFTNNANYKDKLPKTIDDWRSRFADNPVVFQSK